eukprot:ANDGO_04098.mRNA.1 Senescence-specific cysteine protease SAG12
MVLRCGGGVIVVLLSILIVSSAAVDVRDFESWMAKHEKTYVSIAEFVERFEKFAENVRNVDKFNERSRELHGYEQFGMDGPFMDLSAEEFRAYRLLPQTSATELSSSIQSSRLAVSISPDRRDSDLPSSFDWREKNVVTAVQDQTVGDCYAYSALGAMTGQRAQRLGKLEDLSVEMILDCDDKDCSVFGGWPYLVYDWIQEKGGIATETTYPLCCGLTKDGCYPCMANKNTTFCGNGPSYCNRTCSLKPTDELVAQIDSYIALPVDDSQIAAGMYAHGPVSVLLNAELLQFFSGSGIFKPIFGCDPTSLDHAVLSVGWGEEKSITGKVERYWIIKNSWGTKWADAGYFKLSRDSSDPRGVCGINQGSTIPVLSKNTK